MTERPLVRGRARPGRCAGWLAALLAGCAAAAVAAPRPVAPVRPVGFNRDVLPILAENCFRCHGPDRNQRMANLRLDQREAAVGRGAIVPGRPERSQLVARIFAPDPARRMPPASAHRTLSAAQKNLLRRWIAEGAAYETHWAYVPLPAAVPVPAVKDPGWCRNPIDRFVLARLEREGIRPSPEASRSIWLRRVTLDLTGLPPALAEIDAFAADRSPQAYERVVDRLLASPHFGERLAVPWMDVARYADSYGYQSDQLCPTWPYRDWVVQAFNTNLPYDQFITRQLAGDLLPNATRADRLATAFNRLHRMTNEGGSVPEEWRLEGVADRVNTFGTAFLGLTLECARCHDHKYDPVTQREYYALSAFFNSIDEYGLYDRADIVPSPTLLLPTPDQERELAAAQEAATAAERELAAAQEEGEAAFATWRAGPTGRVAAAADLPDMTGRFDCEEFDGVTLRNRIPGAGDHGARLDEVALVDGRLGRGVEFDGENNLNFPQLGRFQRHTPFTIAFWMRDPARSAGARQEPAVVFQACDGTDTGPHGYDLLIEGGVLTARIFRHWPGNAIAVRSRAAIPRDTWAHVAVTYDGSSRAAGLRIAVNGRFAPAEVLRDHLVKGTGQHTLIFGQRFRDRGFKGGQVDEIALFTRALTPLEIARLCDAGSTGPPPARPATPGELRAYYFSAVDPRAREAAARLAAALQRVVAAEDAELETAVMEELPETRATYLLARGRYDAPRAEADRVSRGTPAALPSWGGPAGAGAGGPFPSNRLGLARWLTQPNHPLTSRVAVNRTWSMLFGRGLVETVENFGLQGSLPTHPELLDWLARRFVAGDRPPGGDRPAADAAAGGRVAGPWDLKGLIRLIALSSTYRQASALRPDLAARDPLNRLLARGPSQRLPAEAIRDLALAASGLLDNRLGGPPVSPYQPGDLWREANSMSPAYRQSVGGDLYRRSLYSVLKRTAPMPNMLAFDAVSREVCVARRQATNTPVQALVLLNDPQYVEAARALGERALREAGPTPAERASFAFRALATREPTPEELRLLTALYEEQRSRFAREPGEAAKLLKIGEKRADPTLPPAEVAAAAVLAQTVLNLDATTWKR